MPVSVIISVYNRRQYVAKAVESVLNQSYQDLQLVIIDDASTDGSAEILRALADRDPRILLRRQPVNRGGPTGRNLALSLARHELVACMDDDDIMLPNRLATQVAFMEAHPEVSVLSSAAYLIDSKDRIIGTSVPIVDQAKGMRDHEPNDFVNIIHPTTMYRRSRVLALGAYRDFLLDDRDLWGRMAMAGDRIAVSPEPVLLHRRHSSIMTTRIREVFEIGDYIDFNIVRRMRGEGEISLETYRRLIASEPAGRRLVRWRNRKAAVSFRLATLHYGNRSWLPFLRCLSIACALDPVRYVRRIARKRRGPVLSESGALIPTPGLGRSAG